MEEIEEVQPISMEKKKKGAVKVTTGKKAKGVSFKSINSFKNSSKEHNDIKEKREEKMKRPRKKISV